MSLKSRDQVRFEFFSNFERNNKSYLKVLNKKINALVMQGKYASLEIFLKDTPESLLEYLTYKGYYTNNGYDKDYNKIISLIIHWS